MPKRLPERGYSSYAASEDAFIAEGAHLDHRTDPEEPVDERTGEAEPSERTRLMAQFAIRYDGNHYKCNGFRYVRLADAVNYARLVCAREADQVRQRESAHPGIDTPSDAERSTMAALAISCKDGVYSFAGFDYHHLSDAVHFATLAHGSDGQDHPG
ncbi:hypothetical protein [Rhizobacter sp. Root16D2]|uniref:hypothetical protein n=1 Tax=Rhizobacter sp. Root16D2 TaxID=1736479 RepID=UPI0006FA4670|nr:hypothetical protein [Rhizobacter sp. Root16D2]KRB14692.1 hypothetical protein ASE08_09730 [Rhizobacter sp. Root16D2]